MPEVKAVCISFKRYARFAVGAQSRISPAREVANMVFDASFSFIRRSHSGAMTAVSLYPCSSNLLRRNRAYNPSFSAPLFCRNKNCAVLFLLAYVMQSPISAVIVKYSSFCALSFLQVRLPKFHPIHQSLTL